MNPTEELKAGMGLGDLSILRRLLDTGADIDVQDKDGWTLLMLAGMCEPLEWCTELLKRGASLQVQNHRNKTVWDILDPNDGPALYSLLLQYGADVNQYDPYGRTQLHRACWSDNHPVIVLLLAQGADPRLPLLGGSYKGQPAYDLCEGPFWWSPEGIRARLQWDTLSIQEVFILASERGFVPIPSYLW